MYDTAEFGSLVQVGVFAGLTALVGLLTWLKVRGAARDGSEKDVYLGGKGLTWFFVAGSITLTNLSTDQLVGMNGNQMLLLAWWEIAGFVGLMALAFVFVPLYYRYNCTTVTELLERRYDGRSIRTLISAIFILGNLLIYLPAALYSGGLFLQSLFGEGIPLLAFSLGLALVGAAYTVFGGLRAVAVMDTFSGIGILFLALVIVFLALAAVDFDIVTGVPAERLSMVGAADSPIPFHTLFTGMAFIQIFYWSTNQNITQKAMAAPTVREAQKGVFAAAAVRILVVPPIVVVPGVVAYKLFGDVGDAAYGRLVAEVLPSWLSGAFAAMVAAAVITTFSAVLNSTVALYSVDFHERFVGEVKNHWKLGAIMSVLATALAIVMVPVFQNAESIINLLQQLNGLSSMPILSAFIVGLLFRNVAARSAIAGVVWGIALYGLFTFNEGFAASVGIHYIDFMVVTLFTSVAAALAFNRFALGRRAEWIGFALFRGEDKAAA
ncbi:sodium:solute symporter family transporter [Qipengyuania gaetbuli]|uniref:sodium:solute symporter family transporter n=1 Tax=Qipengyuania gaetbuli TaxID=266952 RepID=UPI001CD21657|nr:SLC5 family protein [Qipengyuania gaetbuli]MCA0909703.1 SLC5 family protein [Qipengyuania gaetbuli]